MNWIDYSTDTVYSFGKPFFFPLNGVDISYFMEVFFYENFTTLTTKNFLRTFEDQLTGIDAMFNPDEEEEIDFHSLSSSNQEFIRKSRLEFREKTKELEDWPLSQLIFSVFYRKLIKDHCPYQNRFWDISLNKNDTKKKAEKIKHILETDSSKNLSDLERSRLTDQMNFLNNLWLEEKHLGQEKHLEEKKVRNTDSSFWYRPLRKFFLKETNKKLSLKILELFLAFVSRHSGFTREFPALRKTLLDLFEKGFINDDAKHENRMFYSLILIPFFDLLGISPVETRLGFLSYVETKDLKVLTNLLIKSQEKESIKEENTTINRETKK